MRHVNVALCCIASNACPKRIFINVYSDVRGLLQSQVYSKHFIDIFSDYCNYMELYSWEQCDHITDMR